MAPEDSKSPSTTSENKLKAFKIDLKSELNQDFNFFNFKNIKQKNFEFKSPKKVNIFIKLAPGCQYSLMEDPRAQSHAPQFAAVALPFRFYRALFQPRNEFQLFLFRKMLSS